MPLPLIENLEGLANWMERNKRPDDGKQWPVPISDLDVALVREAVDVLKIGASDG